MWKQAKGLLVAHSLQFVVSMGKVKKYIVNVCIALDQLVNAILLGDPDETISSRLGKFKSKVPPYQWICWLLDLIDPGHCDEAIEQDEGQDQLLPFAKKK